MLAIFKTGGKQYAVKAGQILKVEKLEGKKGDSISFNKVLAISDNTNHEIGTPLIEGASVHAKILDQSRDKKIIVFKKRKRQNYRHTQGHRQYITILKIESIEKGKKKIEKLKKESAKIEIKSNDVKTKKKTASKETKTTKKKTTKKKVGTKETKK